MTHAAQEHSMKPKKIAIAVHSLRVHTGRTAIILEHTRRFRDCGYEVHLFGERLDTTAVRQAGGVPHEIGKWPLPLGKYLRRYVFSKRLSSRLRSDYDMVFGHGELLEQDVLSPHLLEEMQYENQNQVPMQPLSLMAKYQRRLLTNGQFKVCIANSNLTQSYLHQHFGLSTDRVRVIYPGYDPDRFNPDRVKSYRNASRQHLGIRETDCVIGLITSGAFDKRGLDLLIEALAKVDYRRHHLKLLVVGKDSHIQRYLNAAQARGLGERIIYKTPEPDVERYFAAVDIFTYPSYSETFSMVVQEAMACGLPILTSTQIGACELFDQDQAPLPYLEHLHEDEIAHKLTLILDQADLRSRMIEASITAAKKNSWDLHFQRLLSVCREYHLI